MSIPDGESPYRIRLLQAEVGSDEWWQLYILHVNYVQDSGGAVSQTPDRRDDSSKSAPEQRDQSFEILDGVRRAKAAEIAAAQGVDSGFVSARLEDTGEIIDLHFSQLLAPEEKATISLEGPGLERWQKNLRLRMEGSPAPPIDVKPGSSGVPIPQVAIE